MTERRLYGEDELEKVVAKRVKDRQEIISEAVAAITPALDGVRKEIRDANHIKRTLGQQIANLDRSIKKTASVVDTHTGILDRLTKSVEVIGELGVDTLSQEQRKAFHAVLEEHVRSREERKDSERIERNRQAWLQAVGAAAGAVAGAIASTAGLIAFLRATGVIK